MRGFDLVRGSGAQQILVPLDRLIIRHLLLPARRLSTLGHALLAGRRTGVLSAEPTRLLVGLLTGAAEEPIENSHGSTLEPNRHVDRSYATAVFPGRETTPSVPRPGPHRRYVRGMTDPTAGPGRSRGRFSAFPFPRYSRRTKRGTNVSVGGCCLPIPIGCMTLTTAAAVGAYALRKGSGLG
ncbi:hypothetical protein GCM10022376_25130 [Yimella lutea]